MPDLDASRARYEARHAAYASMAMRLEHVLEALLKARGLAVVFVEGRAKSPDSFAEKVGRKRAKYSDPLSEITDLVGARIVTYYRDDIEHVERAVVEGFTIDSDHSIDKTAALGLSEFGYTGVHYVIDLAAALEDVPEWAADVRAEIQIRTVAQHAWSVVDHKLNYKASHAVPDELRRDFAALSALFELADKLFQQLRDRHAEIETEYAESVDQGDLVLDLNSASIAAYLDDATRLEPAVASARRHGWTVRPKGDAPERDDADRQDLEAVAHAVGLETIGDLDHALERVDDVDRELAALAADMRDARYPLLNSVEDLIAMFLVRDTNLRSPAVRRIWSPDFAAVLFRDR